MDLNKIKNGFLKDLNQVADLDVLNSLKIKYLGRKGMVTDVLRSLKNMSEAKRKEIGKQANLLKQKIDQELDKKVKELGDIFSIKDESIDITLPGVKIEKGSLHPLMKIRQEVIGIFSSMGFSVLDGPEIETEHYNFDALNIPAEHPARDLWDTFWLRQKSKKNKEKLLLRTHTSPMQVRYMEKNNPPFRIIVPGRCFRHEATDASHEMQFYQVEGLMVGKDVSLANMKGVIEEFMKKFYGNNVKMRWQPSYFPFVEPGLELLMGCNVCGGKGCSTCGQSGWIEVIPCGMVHPNVFKAAGYSPEDDLQGFAFGMGLDRIAMMKYKIDDIRLLRSGDLRFLKQF